MRGNLYENNTQSIPKIDKVIMKGSGSRYSALEACNEEVEIGLENDTIEEAAGGLDLGGAIGPSCSNGKARVSKGKFNKEQMNQRVKQTKPGSKDQLRKENRSGSQMKITHVDGVVVTYEDKAQEVKAANLQREKEIMRIMSRKQEEMWRDYKQGENVDDFLGCVGVHVATKELEFIKEHSVKEKMLTNPNMMNTGSTVKEGKANLVRNIANGMVAEAHRNDGETGSC
ncbi:hypothetical protein RIF29_16618 [Crotalaria pallida]|uniref:Uncharacterized protein n=1 Tax=Crotalaria pallida TaxID=3830 RepID=A0AAN9IEM2_CROPI